jgi:hypothetical protein
MKAAFTSVMVPLGDPLSCAVCGAEVALEAGAIALALDTSGKRPLAEAVAVVCEPECKARYTRRDSTLVFHGLAYLDADIFVEEVMPHYRWERRSFDRLLALLAALSLRAEKEASAPRSRADAG